MRTRDARAAARSALFILGVCSAVVTAFTVVQFSSAGTTTVVSWVTAPTDSPSQRYVSAIHSASRPAR